MPLGAFKAALMGVAGVSTGDVVLLSSQTADGLVLHQLMGNIFLGSITLTPVRMKQT